MLYAKEEYGFSQKEDNGDFRAYSSGGGGAKHNPTVSNLTICAEQRKSKLRTAGRARGWKADGSMFQGRKVPAFLCACQLYPGKASKEIEKLETTHVSINRMGVLKYYAAMKVNV